MEQGLAHQMVYGSGESQNTKHHYAGAAPNKKRKSTAKPCKRKKKVVKQNKLDI